MKRWSGKQRLSLFLVSASVVAALLPAQGAEKTHLITIGGVPVWKAKGAVFYVSGMAVDADGAPKAYHPTSSAALDFLANAGRPGNWWALVTSNGKPSGTPVIQTAADPAPGFFVSTTSLQDATKPVKSPAHYVDASTIPYIVLPSAVRTASHARLGDVAMVINRHNGKALAAIFADSGPAGKLGEGSIYLANQLSDAPKVNATAKPGGIGPGIGKWMAYVVFPGSGTGKPLAADKIKEIATGKFTDWGGINYLNSAL